MFCPTPLQSGIPRNSQISSKPMNSILQISCHRSSYFHKLPTAATRQADRLTSLKTLGYFGRMPNFCPHCGVAISEAHNYCSHCGGTLRPASHSSASLLPTNVAAGLCYLVGPVSGIVFLNIEPYRRDRLLRFHAWQSIYFGIAWLALAVFPSSFLSFLWIIVAPLSCAFFILWIILLVKSYQGEVFKLPILGELAQQQADRFTI
jgi:uncharacterized membrane protein